MSDPKSSGSGSNGSTTPPVYMRLQKRAQSQSRRSGPSQKPDRLHSLSIGFLVLLLVTCSLWYLVQYVDTDPRFRLHHVDLAGNKYAARAAVEDLFDSDREGSIYRIPLEERRRELEQIPWVRSASLTRVLPDRVAISLEEREPVAFLWTRQGIELMDRAGVILESPSEVSWTFPVLRGIPERESAEQRRVRMEQYLQLMDGLRLEQGSYPAEISEVDLTDPANLTAVVADQSGALRLHLGDEELKERYEVYRAHISEWRQQFSDIRSIDLRFEGQAVIQSASPFTVSTEVRSETPPPNATSTPLRSTP